MKTLDRIMARLIEVSADSWWEQLTPKQQREYIKEHPNSKYAKATKTIKDDGSALLQRAAKLRARAEKAIEAGDDKKLYPIMVEYYNTMMRVPGKEVKYRKLLDKFTKEYGPHAKQVPTKKTAPAKPAPKPVATSEAPQELLQKLNRITHSNGAGSGEGYLKDAVKNVMAGKPTLSDLITMIQTNNYGGPVSSYKNSVPKSRHDPAVIELLKTATAKARQDAKTELPRFSKKWSEKCAKLAPKFVSPNRIPVVREALIKYLAPDNPTEEQKAEAATQADSDIAEMIAAFKNPTAAEWDSLHLDTVAYALDLQGKELDAVLALEEEADDLDFLHRTMKRAGLVKTSGY